MNDLTTTDTSEPAQGMSGGHLVFIAIAAAVIITGITVRVAWWWHRENKREKEEERKKARETNPGLNSPPGHNLAEQGLFSKPELEGTSVGGVIHKMELDSNPIAELDSSRHVKELDGSGSGAGAGAGRGTTSRNGKPGPDPDPDAITPAPEIRTTSVWERWR
ncbi:hypothetical protein K449DRAFT_437596 [Hypoxylon sp. EC38]|nr:hypothetical protein K449DRAFT_437596 [Hypoxylon sp. EC38]